VGAHTPAAAAAVYAPAAFAATPSVAGLPKVDGFKSGPGPKSEAYVPTAADAAHDVTAVDPASLPAEAAAIMSALADLQARLAPWCQTPAEKKQLAEASKACAVLVAKLSVPNAVLPAVAAKALQLAASVQHLDFAAANAAHKDLSEKDWDLHKDWVKGIKGIIALAQKYVR
jgi:hypothetical protein